MQLLQQQQLPFHAPGDVAQDAELQDSSGLYSESSGTSSPSTSPRASNHSLHSSGSASRAGASPCLEQDDEGKAGRHLVPFSLSFECHLRGTAPWPSWACPWGYEAPTRSTCSHLSPSHSGAGVLPPLWPLLSEGLLGAPWDAPQGLGITAEQRCTGPGLRAFPGARDQGRKCSWWSPFPWGWLRPVSGQETSESSSHTGDSAAGLPRSRPQRLPGCFSANP